MGLFGLTSMELVSRRDDVYGALARTKHRLSLVGEVLVGDEPPEHVAGWWRDMADSVDDALLADRCRQIAALIERIDLP